MNNHNFNGNDIPHIKLGPDTTIDELIDIYSNSGFNGRKLGEASKLYTKMIQNDATICLTISGAMTPVGFGGIFKSLIENGFVDWIITTGSNVYHEDHFAWGLPVKQGHHEVDDMILYEKNIVRIRDVFVKFYETLEAQDQIIQKVFCNSLEKPFTTAEFCNRLGKITKTRSKYPDKSFIATAYEYDVPVYISTLKDSSLALNLAIQRIQNRQYNLDFVREIIEQGAILYNSKKSGIVEIGGGVPKNTAQQTGPLLDQILRKNVGGQDYIIQITDARPDTGGLSGATLQESKSWGKVHDAHKDMVTVYADATIAFPILALYVLNKTKKRKHKKIYKKLHQYYNKLRNDVLQSI
ncbi:MAG: deoxyhypusine synthase [Thaumarchaeota archaeon]|nr:deoxyhypusine synthase [Nitrososphaerota archaeon]MCY3975664.1 deoxyhypusine synthase [Nitrososphaerota archaeon]